MGKTLTVAQLNNYIKGIFEDELYLNNITVTGEIFDISYSGQSVYLVLKEGDSTLSCVCFSHIEGFKVGMKVKAEGSVSYFTKSGRVNFIAKRILLSGEGELFASLMLIKKRLEETGLFSQKRSLPLFIKNVALITSTDGAVVHDFISVIKRRFPSVDITVFPSKVQGEGAAEEIIGAMSDINRGILDQNSPIYRKIDCIVIARGGGSALDLSQFYSENLVKAIVKSVPITISAVGHQTDVTFCDFAADHRAGTPSIAAEMICSNNLEYLAAVKKAYAQLNKNINLLILGGYKKVRANSVGLYESLYAITAAIRSRSLNRVQKIHRLIDNRLKLYRAKTVNAANRSYKIVSDCAIKRQHKTELCAARLDQSSPLKILSKGYALIYKSDVGGQNKVSGTDCLSAGDRVEMRLSDGRASAVIDEVCTLKKE